MTHKFLAYHVKSKPWLAVLLLAVILLVTFPLIKDTTPYLADTCGMEIQGRPDIPVYAINHFGYPHITRTSGHAHSPLGVWGENKYLFDGRIEIKQESYKLRTDGYEPIAATRILSNTYLILQGYFRKYSFQILISNASNEFQVLSLDQLPKELWGLRFKDDDQTCAFRAWLLNELTEQALHEKSIEYFEFLFQLDHRFAFTKEWRSGYKGSSCENIRSFLERIIVPQQALGTLPELTSILNSAERNDDPMMIGCLCKTIIDLDPEHANEIICNFKNSIPDLKDDNDMRAHVFTGFPYFQAYPCPTTSQSARDRTP